MNTRRTSLFALLSLFILLTSWTACGKETSSEKTENGNRSAKLEKTVLGIHDEAMARMGEIMALKDSLQKLESRSPDPERIQTAILQLEAADEGMMIWMRAYNPPAANTPPQAVLSFFQTQLDSVKQVKRKIDDAILEAQTLISDHSHE
jgi:hypothetical protein